MRLLFSAIAILGLSACATMIEDGATQRVSFELASMQKARCWVYNGNGSASTHAYEMFLPGSYVIERSERDLVMDCLGLKGVKTKVSIPAGYSPRAQANVSNLGLGVVVDAMSRALYAYPDVIVVDFTEAVMKQREQQGDTGASISTYVAPTTVTPDLDGLEESFSEVTQSWSDQKLNEIERAHQQFNPAVKITPK